MSGYDDADYADAAKYLEQSGFRYVIMHRDGWMDRFDEACSDMSRILGPPWVADDDLMAWRLSGQLPDARAGRKRIKGTIHDEAR